VAPVTTFDDELRAHYARLRPATGVRPGDHVLDIGCGAGQTTRDAARAAAPGHALGIDISAPMLERARELAAAEGLDNVAFEQGDAQVHAFAPERYDVVISRCGLMFFADPAAALRNIARAMRPGARLVALVWQARERNEWAVAIDDAVGAGELPEDHEPFSLADPQATTAILEGAGFEGVDFTDVDEPMFFGPDRETALEWVRGFRSTSAALDRLDPRAREQALDRLRATLAAHHSDDRGVLFGSRAWIVTAQRRS
jgi:SAM-dependent methyltransferase